jgi:membrane associated rhomboid family serine protease
MFPYRDDNPMLATPWATLLLIAANVFVWVVVQGMGSDPQLTRAVCELGLIPGEYLHRIPAGYELPLNSRRACILSTSHWYTPLTSMFLHGGWLHLIGNMWFLWLFGGNVEDSMGHGRYLGFYLLCGLAAATGQMLLTPDSPVPMVGASGAISGVMGAYIMLYPRVHVHMLVILIIFITRIAVPAWVMLGYWFLLQLVGGWSAFGADRGGVAFAAHVAGFLAGAILVRLFRDPVLVAEHRTLVKQLYGYYPSWR